ncbi:MAG: xanthine dehydrogenase family protein molybdopterin-binding subunit [candidate division Zixibacteria bacterium]|nr:xanthine dehydrogenase family protein molybdopterin-binding subunit [candidate division Zixibacteria bacterium]
MENLRYINHSRVRVDAVEKVTGRAKYAYDLNLPGMLYGRILRSVHPRARIKRIDASRAVALAGVKAVVLPSDAPNVFAQECRYAGQEVAAVAASTPEIAEDALRLIVVEYEILPFVVDVDQALKPESTQVHADRKNVSQAQIREQGDVAAGFAAADATFEATYRCQVHTHSALETHGSVAKWDGDQLTAWASTQSVFGFRDGLAKYFGLPETKVRVITEHMGGGFGAKLGDARPEGVICALLARKAGVPVKLLLNRKEEHLTTGNRPSAVQQVKVGIKNDGSLVAYQRYNYGTPGIAGSAGIPAAPYLYNIPNWRVEQVDVFTHAGPAAALRAPGHPQAAFSMESVIDEIAEKINMDPLDIRQKNDPDETRRKMVEMGAEKIGWKTRRKPKPDTGPDRVKRGIGMGSCTWGGGGGRTRTACTIHTDGSVEVRCGTQDIGTGTRTVIHMIAGEEFGLVPEAVNVRIGDTRLPWSGGSGGSTTCASVSPAVKFTTMMAKLKLFEAIAPKFGVAATALEAKDGKVYVKDDPSKSMTWRQTTAQLQDGPIEFQGSWVPGYSGSGVPGVQFAEVEVDTWTGLVKVLKVLAVHTSGLVMNPLTWESQINGGVLMGIGYGLYEDRIMDPATGYMVNANLEDYRLVGAMEVPEIEVLRYDQPERGVIGIGEPPIIPTAGAIANAVYNACGARVRDLPITPDKVLAALGHVREG